ncbi:hypothetical protein LLG95_09875 [bacterium]|nr:hypothetical protein [bacterium]
MYWPLDWAIEVAEKTARNDRERNYTVEFKKRYEETYFPGKDFHVEEEIPSIDERKFWARVFFDTMLAIYNRELGNATNTCWQTTAIGIIYIVARMITQSVRDVEPHWRPEPACRVDEQIYTGGGMNVQL